MQLGSMPPRDVAPITELTDSKGRTWRVTDLMGTSQFDCAVPMGSSRAMVRRFVWQGERSWDRMTRWYFLRSPRLQPDEPSNPAARATDSATVWRQLRASWSFDDHRSRSTAEAIQELYSTRGMGRR